MKKAQLKVGIAGFGVVGKRRRQVINQNPLMTVVAVCDQAYNQPGVMEDCLRYYPDYKSLLKEGLDVLFVCLPNYLAAEVTIAGLRKGLHVFCEKPPGKDVADIRRVIKVEKKHPGLVLKYGFNHRYHDSVRAAMRLVKSGELGKVINLRGVYGKSRIIPFSGGWRSERKYAGGGILLDQGIHMVDLIRLFCSDFVEVKSYVSNDIWRHDVEDNAYALMKDSQSRVAMLHSTATQWRHRFSLEISLTKGFLELQGILSGSKSYGQEKLIIGRRDESDNGATNEKVMTFLQDNSWQDEVNEFAEAIVKKKKIISGNSADALSTMELVYQIYYSDPKWRKVYGIKK